MRQSKENQALEPTGTLVQCNDFERAVCRTVFQDRYSESVKTYHVIDHLEHRGVELGLMQNGAYRNAIDALSRFRKYHSAQINGFVGERRAYNAVKHAQGDHVLLTNIELDHEGEHDEYDQILITRQGLIVIEVKNYSAPTTLCDDGVIRYDDGRPGCFNVAERMGSKVYVLAEIASTILGRRLEKEDIRCLLVNANDKCFIKNEFKQITVCSCGSVTYLLGSLHKEKERFNDCEIDLLRDAIVENHNPADVKPDLDFERISSSLHEALALIAETSEEVVREAESFETPSQRQRAANGEAKSAPRIRTILAAVACYSAAALLIGLASNHLAVISR